MRNKVDVRKLSVRRETVRRLASLGTRDLARVAGGTNESGGVDPEGDTGGTNGDWTNSQTLSTMSRFC
ncbi:MAG TPA: hypothetical protein VIG06_09610 [Kofleriaceae bacterium]